MNHIDLSSLYKYLRTTNDAQEVQLLLNGASEKLFNAKKQVDVTIKETIPYEIANSILTLAQKYNITIQDNLQMQTFLRQLSKSVNDLPVVSLTLARFPQETTISMIQAWFFQEYKKNVLIDVKVDNNLLAGAIVESKGKYRDYSLRQLLEGRVKN